MQDDFGPISIDNQSIRVLWHISTGNMLVTR